MPNVYCVFADEALDGIYGSASKAVARLLEYGPAAAAPNWPGTSADEPLTVADAEHLLRTGRHVYWTDGLSAMRWTVR